MRTSLLLQREPFGLILGQTLSRYWEHKHGKAFAVDWLAAKPGPTRSRAEKDQVWFGNIYLNFFATEGTPGEAFEVLRREYGRSVHWWRRVPQRAYVAFACSRVGLARLAHVAFAVKPAVPEAGSTLVLGGNRRLRLLHPARGASTVLLKHGFAARYLADEVRVRQELRLEFTPRLLSLALDQGWYEEEYIAGTPANRLPVREAGALEEDAHARLAADLIKPTLQSVRSRDWIAQRVQEGSELVVAAPWPEPLRQTAHRCLSEARLASERTLAMDDETATALAHGDFQPANVLRTSRGPVVIDWECVGRRFAGYDPLVYLTGSRTCTDLSRRVRKLLELDSGAAEAARLRQWPGIEWQRAAGQRQALLLFLVEELIYMLHDNCEPDFIQPDAALASLLDEWRASMRLLV